ncbi:NAD-dependent deacetylase sirtuin-2 [Tothia fuscella]|uniref:NAD-dependent protein deacetylase n=1 Tax=Tothia fuscella TaxID=1048955 RepID=A0A9P4NI24_9PEZI|nr:NAD-dependent deacetylase sirtuin-2 [Tothia fuscella]
MGQEESTPIDESSPPFTLETRTVEGLAKYIKDGRARRIVVMSGAGISTSAGIPDFRSPDTGLYANLARLNLPYAEAVFSIDYFRQKPEPFYELASELFPGKFRPTITHSFITLLHRKGLLLKHFTQNIDCLDREAGLPGEMTVEAHGSFATQRCIDCKLPYPDDEMLEKVKNKDIPCCKNESCNGLVKPDIVFFGEALPAEFFANRELPQQADLAIIMGSSLTVMPFAGLPQLVREETPRLLINLERVGGIGSRRDDVLLLEDCDSGVKKLAEALGWLEELEEMWATTGVKFGVEPEKKEEEGMRKSKDEKLEDEITKLTKDVDETLLLCEKHESRVRSDFDREAKKLLEKQMKMGDSGDEQEGDDDAPPAAEGSKGHRLSHVFGHLKKGSSL